MLSCVSLAVEVACKETEDTLVFRSATCMQTTVIAQGSKTAFGKERSSPVTQESPEKVSTYNIFPLVPGVFFLLIMAWLFKLQVVLVQD